VSSATGINRTAIGAGASADADNKMQFGAANVTTFDFGPSPTLTTAAIGYGIGVTPTYALHVSGSCGLTGSINFENSQFIWTKNTSGTVLFAYSPCSSDNDTYFNFQRGMNFRNSGNTSITYFTSGGYVGIGTTAPSGPFQVVGGTKAAGTAGDPITITGQASADEHTGGAINITSGNAGGNNNDNHSGDITLYTPAPTNGYSGNIYLTTANTYNPPGSIYINTGYSGASSYYGNVIICSNATTPYGGYVGIGTSSPTTKLFVTYTSATVATFKRSGSEGTIISIQSSGGEKGTISVSGETVSFNAFTGSHYASVKGEAEKGMLMSLTGENTYLHNDKNSEIIYGVEKIDPENITVELTLTSPGCPIGPQLMAQVQQTLLEAVQGVKSVDVKLIWDPPWDPSQMSEEAKEALAKIINKDKLSESELIKQALRQLGK